MCHCVPESQRARVSLDPAWLNAHGDVVHPDAPSGGGGTGYFRTAGATRTNGGSDELAHPDSPEAPRLDTGVLDQARQLNAGAVTRQPAPEVKTPQVQVIKGMTVTIKPDEKGVASAGSALTDVTNRDGGAQYTHDNATLKVISWKVVPYKVDIVTQYGTGKPNDDAAYGRGTLQSDIDAGNVTLGFHESCHRNDMLAYLKDHDLPAFVGKTGISTTEGDAMIKAYTDAVDGYFQAARDHSVTVTDEVGKKTKSQWEAE
jgi:hypothetical protein